MDFIKCKTLGYCPGVKRTIESADKCISLAIKNNSPYYCIGNLIHNENVVSLYEQKGLVVINSPSDGKAGVALVRAHGICDDKKAEFEKSGFTLIDSTCPNIKASIKAMLCAYNKGRKIVVVGLDDHAETRALTGVKNNSKYIVEFELNDVSGLNRLYSTINEEQKISIIVQTTFPEDLFESLSDSIKNHYRDVKIENSFCKECLKRKENALDLSQHCDAIITIGSKNSANTVELYSFLKKNNVNAFFIEDKDHLDKETVRKISAFKTIGVCSGTSTPDWVIDDVIGALTSST